MAPLDLLLLVDDSEADIFLLRRVITKGNVAKTIQVAHHGQQAINLLSTPVDGEYLCPDIIFLDVNMPLMNGWEFLEAYQRLDLPVKKAPIIYMLSHSMNPEDFERASEIGIVKSFLTKYLTLEKLLSIVEDWRAETNERSDFPDQ